MAGAGAKGQWSRDGELDRILSLLLPPLHFGTLLPKSLPNSKGELISLPFMFLSPHLMVE